MNKVFIIEGEIAAGKTELIKSLNQYLTNQGLKVCLILEPVDMWRSVGILQKFYENPKRYGYAFQTYVFSTLIQNINKQMKENYDIIILERSPATSQIFMMLLDEVLEEVEKEMYKSWCDTFKELLHIDFQQVKVLYLKPNLSTCMERLMIRNRKEETSGGVSLEYQTKLRKAHEAFFQNMHKEEFPNTPINPFKQENITVLDGDFADQDFTINGKKDIVEKIWSMLNY